MKVTLSSSFIQTSVFFSSLYSQLSKKIQALWQRIWGHPNSFSYAFSQQTNPDCHLQMWLNFNRLKELRAKHPSRKLILEAADFKTHRQWLGLSFPHFQKWVELRQGPFMKNYIEEALTQAPCAPELFYSNGKPYVNASWSPVERAERSVFAPVFLAQVQDEDLAFVIPMYEENGNYFCYNQETCQYEQTGLKSIEEGFSPANLILSKGQRASLPPHFESLKLRKLPGKTHFIKAFDPKLALNKRYIPRHLGTYKLLLMSLGAEHELKDKDPNARVRHEIQEAMRAKDTPWSPTNCQKENLIEYRLARLFQEDQALATKVHRHVDFFFRTWSRYTEDLRELHNNQGHPFSQQAIDRYLPGKEQMLAYCLMKNIQFLWVSAISSKAFFRHIGLSRIAQWLPFTPSPLKYRKAAYQVKEGSHFIEVWKEVAARLQRQFPEQNDWVSFSGHGMVFSFDSELIKLQNERSISDPELANDLGVAGIDSLYGKEMDVFYRLQTQELKSSSI
jgi:hypothetical protein